MGVEKIAEILEYLTEKQIKLYEKAIKNNDQNEIEHFHRVVRSRMKKKINLGR